jgi:transketolase
MRDRPPLAVEAAELRGEIVDALHAAGGGHYGGALSVIDLLLVLYRTRLRLFPEAPLDPHRDRVIFSKGHAAIALYAVLRRLGFFADRLDTYAQFGSRLEGHPDMAALPGVDFSSGSLGQGLAVGVGMALALASPRRDVWVILGDGECQEGQVWEAAMLAARYRLGHLHAIVDLNGYQEWGWHDAPHVDREPIPHAADKWRAFGWHVVDVDGHDHEALADAYVAAADPERPSVVLAHTIKGKGYPLLESDPIRFHCATLTAAEAAEVRR